MEKSLRWKDDYTFALAGRKLTHTLTTQGVASLALGLELIGPTGRTVAQVVSLALCGVSGLISKVQRERFC